MSSGMKIEKILEQVDRYFDENKAKEAEKLLQDSLAEAKRSKDSGSSLQLLNELIGYYRQTSERQKLLETIGEALQTAKEMGLEGTVPYATTALNAANGYRSLGDRASAHLYYRETEKIYEEELPAEDMRLAGFYNNYSLLWQEEGKDKEAEEYLLKALQIVEDNQAGFEIAVTYANLANTALMGYRFEEAREYAKTAIRCFQERNTYDAHYCAALSALGSCSYREGDYAAAIRYYEEGMEIIEKSLGRNYQYERLEKNCNLAKTMLHKEGGPAKEGSDRREAEMESKVEAEFKAKFKAEFKGLQLSKAYYETLVRPMLEEKFPEYLTGMAVGLAGEGSDCFGYDDARSRDHDWGPDVCIWLTEEVYEQIGEALEAAYQELPTEFMGYQRTFSAQGKGRRGVMKISDFYRKFVGTDRYEEILWDSVPDYALAAAVNGEVFWDGEGSFTAFRERLLTGYPEAARFRRLAQEAAMFSQTGQYNYFRMLERGDRMTADRMLCESIGHAAKLLHYICNVYPPHDKWLLRSTAELENGTMAVPLLEGLHSCLRMSDQEAWEQAYQRFRELGEFLAGEMYAGNLTSDIESYLEAHTDELVKKSRLAEQSNEELVSQIAKMEFKAFDKVKNEGGRASCQNDWPTFAVMRKSQYLTWDRDMLLQYAYDFERELSLGHNLITEKYGRMMESTAPEKYRELEQHFPKLSPEKKQIIEKVVEIQMKMMEEFAKVHPKVAGNARILHTYEDSIVDTSYETYLRGEISTYSDKMLQLYARFVIRWAQSGESIPRQTIENTARLYGYPDLESFEASIS